MYRSGAIFMKIDYFSRKTHFLRFGFLTHLTDAYETAPGPSSGAEIQSPRAFLHPQSIENHPRAPGTPKYLKKSIFQKFTI